MRSRSCGDVPDPNSTPKSSTLSNALWARGGNNVSVRRQRVARGNRVHLALRLRGRVSQLSASRCVTPIRADAPGWFGLADALARRATRQAIFVAATPASVESGPASDDVRRG